MHVGFVRRFDPAIGPVNPGPSSAGNASTTAGGLGRGTADATPNCRWRAWVGRRMPRTTISLETETRDRLKQLGRKGETYDELVNRLIDHFEEAQEAEDEEEIEFDPIE